MLNESTPGGFGRKIALSEDGLTLAVGSPWYNCFSGIGCQGRFQVFRWHDEDNDWVLMGNQTFDGDLPSTGRLSSFGFALVTNGGGDLVVAGEHLKSLGLSLIHI